MLVRSWSWPTEQAALKSCALEVRLEHLERGQRLPARVHLDVQVLAVVHVGDGQEEEPDRAAVLVGPCRTGGPRRHRSRSAAWSKRSWIASSITSIEEMVGSCAPGVDVPRLVGDPLRRRGRAAGIRVLGEGPAEVPRGRSRRVGEPQPRRVRVEHASERCDVPVEQEEGRESLLAVERAEHAVLDVAVDEVETHALRRSSRRGRSRRGSARGSPWFRRQVVLGRSRAG